LFIAVLPALGAGGKVLFQTEVPGPVKEGLTPRIRETALHLWKIYVGLTVIQTVILLFTSPKMEWLDAITITFSTLSTGGFSIRNTSIAFYDSASTDFVVILFMILGSINFSLFFQIVKGKLYRLYEPEFLLYMCVLFMACSLGAWTLFGAPQSPLEGIAHGIYDFWSSIRYGAFQIISAITSTGFVTANFDPWPYPVQVLMLIVMFIGGMSGSTAGGIKIIRHYMMFKIGQHQVEGLFHPEAVRNFKIGNKEVDSSAVRNLFCYFLLCVFCSILGTYLYVLNGEDPETAIGLVACMVNNTGLAFRAAGPTGSCAFMNDFAYLLSSFLMIVGRLEFLAVFAFLVPSFWKEN
jgi:trk system potassium uptake protein TrkH